MNTETIITMILILGIVWGGLILFLFKAYRSEIRKTHNGNG
ncbi:MAG: MetS family NSS transporter small subunit [Ignavibacteria bacterium]|nr:MetS family NSS transporter small subunit [Ignavibacteria bacterium]MBT8383252.1 MetS family NSS transporter small subunit [Ignavibacteria bacterium]MBT8390357.1 MetS family NSS transporter small subunit [Ignavibacteria bacterium]NNJ53383.1 MetS family NSS transporter small subunit [Ignavibacteriaceae bacterium]NNL21602.1 MetS family NSS transporter small subunit [Ignavibacteriaceae bacterium]